MNKVILMGRLTRDPEMRYANTGDLAIVTFSLAVNRRYKKEGQTDADFINCTAFGKTGEFINKYFSKGKKIAITGRIQTSSWEDDTGKRQYKTEVIVEEAEFVESKQSNNGNTQSMGRPAPQAKANDGFATVDDDDDELPF